MYKRQELHCVNTGMADDMVMAEKVCSLQQRVTELEMETRELREHNDLLEFRLMELDDGIGSNCSSNLHFNKVSLCLCIYFNPRSYKKHPCFRYTNTDQLYQCYYYMFK